MKRALLASILAAGCASSPARVETAELRPVPRSAEAAEASKASAAAVLPSEQADAARERLAQVRARGAATLADCFALAEATHEDLLSGEEDRLQAALQRDLAVAGILPAVSLSAYAFVQDRTSSTGSSSGGGGSFGGAGGVGRGSSVGRDSERWAVTVRQPIFRGFAEIHAIEASDLTQEARTATIDVVRAALRRSTARAFFGVLEAEADVRTLEDSERLDRSRVDEMKAREEHGIARRTEVLLLESQLQQTLGALRRARTQRQVTRTTLFQLLGVELPTPLVDAPSGAEALPTRAVAIAEALRSRRELVAAGFAAEAAEKSVEVARGAYWPSVSFVGNWYLGASGVASTTKETDWDAQISLDFPFFEGGATDVRQRVAKSNARKARLLESAALRSIVQDVESALARAAADAELSATFERNVQIATENVTLLREEYAHGVATNLEVLTAQNVLQEAQIDLERQRLESRLDRVELALALGRTEIER